MRWRSTITECDIRWWQEGQAQQLLSGQPPNREYYSVENLDSMEQTAMQHAIDNFLIAEDRFRLVITDRYVPSGILGDTT